MEGKAAGVREGKIMKRRITGAKGANFDDRRIKAEREKGHVLRERENTIQRGGRSRTDEGGRIV